MKPGAQCAGEFNKQYRVDLIAQFPGRLRGMVRCHLAGEYIGWGRVDPGVHHPSAAGLFFAPAPPPAVRGRSASPGEVDAGGGEECARRRVGVGRHRDVVYAGPGTDHLACRLDGHELSGKVRPRALAHPASDGVADAELVARALWSAPARACEKAVGLNRPDLPGFVF